MNEYVLVFYEWFGDVQFFLELFKMEKRLGRGQFFRGMFENNQWFVDLWYVWGRGCLVRCSLYLFSDFSVVESMKLVLKIEVLWMWLLDVFEF